jgi:hypothetical protein
MIEDRVESSTNRVESQATLDRKKPYEPLRYGRAAADHAGVQAD